MFIRKIAKFRARKRNYYYIGAINAREISKNINDQLSNSIHPYKYTFRNHIGIFNHTKPINTHFALLNLPVSNKDFKMNYLEPNSYAANMIEVVSVLPLDEKEIFNYLGKFGRDTLYTRTDFGKKLYAIRSASKLFYHNGSMHGFNWLKENGMFDYDNEIFVERSMAHIIAMHVTNQTQPNEFMIELLRLVNSPECHFEAATNLIIDEHQRYRNGDNRFGSWNFNDKYPKNKEEMVKILLSVRKIYDLAEKINVGMDMKKIMPHLNRKFPNFPEIIFFRNNF